MIGIDNSDLDDSSRAFPDGTIDEVLAETAFIAETEQGFHQNDISCEVLEISEKPLEVHFMEEPSPGAGPTSIIW
jgi:hypothetical protein